MARSYRTRTLGPSVFRRPAYEAFRSRRPRSIPGPLGHVALVVGNPASLNGTDTAWRDWIQELGFTVTLIDDITAENKDFDLICISESVSSGNLSSQKYYPDTAGDPPAIIGEQGIWADWGWANGTTVATGTTATYLTGADDYVDWTGETPNTTVTVYSSTQVAYEVTDVNMPGEGVVPLVDSPGGTGTIVSYRPVGPNIVSLADNPAYSPIIQWGLSGNGPNPTTNATAAHKQLFQDCVLTLLNIQPGAGLWQGIFQRSELAWRANEASPDTDATTVTSLSNQGQNTEATADTEVSGTPTKELDFFATGYDGIEIIGTPTFEAVKNDNGFVRDIDTLSAGVTMWWIGQVDTFTTLETIFRISGPSGNPERLSIHKDASGHFGVRVGNNGMNAGATVFTADTPYLIVAYFDEIAGSNSWVEVNNVSEVTSFSAAVNWRVDGWGIPHTGGAVDNQTLHAAGVVLGEATTALKADLWTYAQLAGAVGGAAVAVTGSADASAGASANLAGPERLTGSADAASVASSSLSALVPITASAPASSAASGNLTGVVPITGSVDASAGASGDLTGVVPISGSAPASSAASGNLTADVPVTGSAPAAAGASGDLQIVGGAIAVTGSADAAAAASGALSGSVPVTGSADASAAASGSSSALVPVTGNADASSAASGDLTGVVPITGSANAASLASGDLTGIVPITGSSSSSSAASGDLTGAVPVAGSADASSATSGDLAALVPISASAPASSAVSGALSALVPVTASSNSSSAGSGDASIKFGVDGSADAAAGASGILVVDGSIDLTGSADASSAASGSLSALVPITATADAASATTGNLTGAVPVSAVASAASVASADLFVGVLATGSAPASSAASGTLIATVPVLGSAPSSAGASGTLSALVPITGSADGSAATNGNLTGASDVVATGSASASSAASGSLIATVPVIGSAPSSSTISGAIGIKKLAAASAPASSASSGTVVATVPVIGSAPASAFASSPGLVATGTIAIQVVCQVTSVAEYTQSVEIAGC